MYSSLDVPFPSSREATIALRSLAPDREPRKGGISKQLSVSGSTLSVWERLLENDQYIERKTILPCAEPYRLCVSGGGVQMKPASSECPWPRLWIICRSCWKPWRCSDPQFPTEAWLMTQDTYLIISPHPSRGLDSGATSSGKHEKWFNLLVLNSCQDDVITILNVILDLNAFVILYYMEIKKKKSKYFTLSLVFVLFVHAFITECAKNI